MHAPSGYYVMPDLLLTVWTERADHSAHLGSCSQASSDAMASRRLQSDRFFTSDYREEIYSTQGVQWVEEATFARRKDITTR